MRHENGFAIILVFRSDGVEWSKHFVDRLQLELLQLHTNHSMELCDSK